MPEPTQLDPARATALLLCLQGLSVAADVCQLSYSRARATARALEKHVESGAPLELVVELIADVWTIVDSIHRYRELINRAPYLPKKDPSFKLFLTATDVCEDLRHYVQHFQGSVSDWAGGPPLWGALSWVSELDCSRSYSVALIDSVLGGSGGSIAFDRVVGAFVCELQVEAAGHRLEIDKAVKRLAELDVQIDQWSRRLSFLDGRTFVYRSKLLPLISIQILLDHEAS